MVRLPAQSNYFQYKKDLFYNDPIPAPKELETLSSKTAICNQMFYKQNFNQWREYDYICRPTRPNDKHAQVQGICHHFLKKYSCHRGNDTAPRRNTRCRVSLFVSLPQRSSYLRDDGVASTLKFLDYVEYMYYCIAVS